MKFENSQNFENLQKHSRQKFLNGKTFFCLKTQFFVIKNN